MKILLLGLNYAPEAVGIGLYTTGMAEGLASAGHQVRVIAGQPYYPAWRKLPGFQAFTTRRENGVRVMRVPHYVPKRPTGAKRIVHHLSFGLASIVPALWAALTWRPDVVIAVAPSMASAPIGKMCAALSGSTSWLHVQDFEVDAATATGLLGPLAGRVARWVERLCLLGFDRVSTIAPSMCARLKTKGVLADRIVELRNWADPRVAPLADPSTFRQQWNIGTPHVALYAGTIGNKQGLEIVVNAARLLRDRSDLTFVVCGDAPSKTVLHDAARDLANIRFFGQQSLDSLSDLLGLASVHLLPQRDGASGLLFPSKLANMLASGRPVVTTAQPGSDLAETVRTCGLVTPPGDSQAFADAITTLLDDPEFGARCAQNGRVRAATAFNKTTILSDLEAQLLHLAGADRELVPS